MGRYLLLQPHLATEPAQADCDKIVLLQLYTGMCYTG